jgi:hypothetical protein
MNETRELLERVGERFAFPERAFEGLERRRHRKRRNQRITAGAVGIAVFVTMVWIATTGGPLDRTDTPAATGPPTPGVTAIDQTFIDTINDCERLLVTPRQVESALGFTVNDPAPFELGGTPDRVGVADPLSTGCEYASLDLVPALGQPVMGHEGLGGEVVITAYLADAPPRPLGRFSTVRGIGDAATFTPYGNGDEHLPGPEGATSVLEVRSGDLILRFNAGSYDVDGNVVVRQLTGVPVQALRRLAESALAGVDEMPVVSGPTDHSDPPSSKDARRTRTVEGITFSFSAHHSWVDGPINGLADGGFRQGHLLISKSIRGPQGAEGVIFWTDVSGGPRAEPCGDWFDPAVDNVADLAAAVAAAPGTELVSGPSGVTVGGYPAQRVVVIAREEVFCDPGFFYRWYSECWGPCWTESTVGDTIRVWIVDVGGTPLFIEAETSIQANHRLVQEIQRIVGSIRFG